MDQPFFLIGSERSGSTMCRLMLDHHPQLACNLESDFLVSQIGDDGQLPTLADYHGFLRRDRIFRHSRFSIDESLSYPALMDSFLEQKRLRQGKRLVGATVHHHFDRLPVLWPNARFIYLLRDGRDVARSALNLGWAGNSWCGADLWLEAEARWRRMRRRLAPDQFIEVRYEDLVQDPAGTLGRICVFLGVAYDNAMLRYSSKSSYAAPDPRLIGQWRSKGSALGLRLLEARIGDALAARYYPASGYRPFPWPALLPLPLRLHSKLVCFAARVRSYGYATALAEFFGRKLGLERLRAQAQARFDLVIDQNLK